MSSHTEHKKNLKPISKEEIRAFYNKIEAKGDPYFKLLPFPEFMVKEDPEKYGGMTPQEYENLNNLLKCEEIRKQDVEKAKECRQNYLKSLKPIQIPRQKEKYGKVIDL